MFNCSTYCICAIRIATNGSTSLFNENFQYKQQNQPRFCGLQVLRDRSSPTIGEYKFDEITNINNDSNGDIPIQPTV